MLENCKIFFISKNIFLLRLSLKYGFATFFYFVSKNKLINLRTLQISPLPCKWSHDWECGITGLNQRLEPLKASQ